MLKTSRGPAAAAPVAGDGGAAPPGVSQVRGPSRRNWRIPSLVPIRQIRSEDAGAGVHVLATQSGLGEKREKFS